MVAQRMGEAREGAAQKETTGRQEERLKDRQTDRGYRELRGETGKERHKRNHRKIVRDSARPPRMIFCFDSIVELSGGLVLGGVLLHRLWAVS